MSDIKQLGKGKCSTRNCKEQAEGIFKLKEYCKMCYYQMKEEGIVGDWLLKLGSY